MKKHKYNNIERKKQNNFYRANAMRTRRLTSL